MWTATCMWHICDNWQHLRWLAGRRRRCTCTGLNSQPAREHLLAGLEFRVQGTPPGRHARVPGAQGCCLSWPAAAGDGWHLGPVEHDVVCQLEGLQNWRRRRWSRQA